MIRDLRVLVDASIVKPQQTGISTYTRALSVALSRRVDVVVASSEPSLFVGLGLEVVVLPTWSQGYTARQVWREFALRRLVAAQGADLVLVPAPEVPLIRLPVPVVCVVHDVGPLVKPQLYPWLKRARFRALIETLRRATALVAVSQSTAGELQRFIRGADSLVTVIGEGAGSFDRSRDRRPPATRPYALYFGTALPHKNLETLAQAARLIPGCRVVMAGPGTERFGTFENVDGLGWVSDDQLDGLLADAALAVNPSLHEGFGLPALEAMAAGRPVLLSEIPAFREVAGDAACYVSNPRSPSAWADSINALVGDHARLADLATAGPEHARLWSWDRAADQFVALFDTLVTGGAAEIP